MNKERLVTYHANPNKVARTFLYRLSDDKTKEFSPAVAISEQEARKLNTPEHQFGIFTTVNAFPPNKRKKSEILRVNAFYADFDKIEKRDQFEKIRNSPLMPSLVNESKNGYHVYWLSAETDLNLAVKSWDRIMKRGIIPYFKCDANAADLARLLRMPGYYHLKDPSDPFLVRNVFKRKCFYTIQDMLKAFPDSGEKKRMKKAQARPYKECPGGTDVWDQASKINCMDALSRFSGTKWVNGETFSFRDNGDGTNQIYVDNKSTSCWIDANGFIGSLDEAGPTILQWLKWYLSDYKKVLEAMAEVYPECQKKQLSLI